HLLKAYPAELPNLPAVTLRQLNTNAPRSIDGRRTGAAGREAKRQGLGGWVVFREPIQRGPVPVGARAESADGFKKPVRVHRSHPDFLSRNNRPVRLSFRSCSSIPAAHSAI